MNTEKIRVLIVDDSALRVEMLKAALCADPCIEIAGTADNGQEGVKKALAIKPDVITMDVNMPVMDGFEAIETIMKERPTAIIAVSSADVNTVVKALSIGAMDYVTVSQDIQNIAEDLIDKIKIAKRVKPLRRMNVTRRSIAHVPVRKDVHRVIAVGVSTGGPAALQRLFSALPKDLPASILVVQHITRGFIRGLVEYLKLKTGLDIEVAQNGEALRKAAVYFAPDDYLLRIGGHLRVELSENTIKSTPFVPSIDVMMTSIADTCQDTAIGVIMTGMANDGVNGIQAIKKAGGITIAQDQETSAIYGMNRLAVETGCIDYVLPLDEIAGKIIDVCCQPKQEVLT